MTRKIPITITPQNKCGFCQGAKCCQYITHPIETPRSKADFDYMLWQVSHEHVSFYKDEDGWYMMFETACRHLDNGRCGIYDQRPQICRDHSNDYCEFDAAPQDGWELFFEDYEALLAYCKRRFTSWGQ